MSDPKSGIALSALAALSQTTAGILSELLAAPYPDFPDLTIGQACLGPSQAALPHHLPLYSYSDALTVEIARQLSDYSGLAMIEAMRIALYAGAIRNYEAYPDRVALPARKADADFWIAIVGTRNTWGDEPRGDMPVTSFGDHEYWSMGHYDGSFDQVTAAVKSRMIRDSIDYPDSDFARLFMTNVSAADRRLRKRADEIGINIDGDQINPAD